MSRDCGVCRRYIQGTVQDPVIHISRGLFCYRCFRARHNPMPGDAVGVPVEDLQVSVENPLEYLPDVEEPEEDPQAIETSEESVPDVLPAEPQEGQFPWELGG